MKQLFQDLKDGTTELREIPSPEFSKDEILIRSISSVVSSGTEKSLVDFGKGNFLSKALQQPEKVAQVIDKVKTDGISSTYESVTNKLNEPISLGYCNLGEVIGVGSNIEDIKIGDRVISNGAHAEVVTVSRNLFSKVPDSVSNDNAVFTVIAAIALQGVRLCDPRIGETVVVSGIGLIGLIVVQILRANGCNVIALDFNEERLKLAEDFGAITCNLSNVDDPVQFTSNFNKNGVDAVIISASTTSDDPVHQAAQMCRKRGKIILVGVTGLNLIRDDFYEKELTFQVSCSYGPGRYDPFYEKKGHDYPIGFVRWTEQRNFEAVLHLMNEGKVDCSPLITNKFQFNDCKEAYDLLTSNKKYLGILLEYNNQDIDKLKAKTIKISSDDSDSSDICEDGLGTSFIGSGQYAASILIPLFSKSESRFVTIGSKSGFSASKLANKFNFKQSSTDIESIIKDKNSKNIVISTRHDTHEDFIVRSLKANKNIFVEKPLCITFEQLEHIKKALIGKDNILMVGFNRRFSPYISKIKDLIRDSKSNNAFVMTVNAGFIPDNHWTQDKEIGGGRIVGEACHFIDLLRFLASSEIVGFSSSVIPIKSKDSQIINLSFKNGCIGVINYLSNGNKKVQKEKLEVYSDGKIIKLNNFKSMYGYGFSNFKKMSTFKQDKGQKNCVDAFMHSAKNELASPIPIDEILEVAKVSLSIGLE